MEKKCRQPVSSSSKGLGTSESKKSQDVVGGKLWPRGGRRREPSSGSFPAKSETSRKPNPQRTKTTLDKRPRARNFYPGTAVVSGKESTRIDECDEPELGSVFVQGSKKQSLNHLLNFHYAPRETQQHQTRQTKGGNQRWITTGKHKYNKEHFIQANCQFIVNTSGDYKQYMNNPDALVDWSLIEQVNLQVHELPSCPICLYSPVAAKMTRCGHIYCWSCVLHYLALSDKTWRKCPICYESVHRQDLKSVVPIPHSSFNVNETITFKLMKRVRGSLVAYPFEEDIRNENTIHNMSDEQAAKIYCKLLLADQSDIMSIIDREKHELQDQLLDNENCPENCFIEQAISLLKERENVILSNLDSNLNVDAKPFTPIDLDEGIRQMKIDEEWLGGRRRFESVGSDEFGNDKVGHSSGQPLSKYFYFYQAADGQHIYLHAVNVRMLEHTYGSLEFSPKTITGRIIEKEGGSMTEELRKRLRYLQHLPVTCQFEVAEIHLHTSVISKETLDFFGEQLDIRKKRRQRRARDEKRREKRIAEEENRQMGKFPTAHIELESTHQFPEFGAENRQRTFSNNISRSPSPSVSSISEQTTGSVENEYSGPSFAKMLSTVKQQRSTWPGLNSVTKEASPARLINVTGSQNANTTIRRVKRPSESEPECDDYVPAPEYNRSFSDAIAHALEIASRSNETGNTGEGKLGKKKKKNKQKILFATSMAYSGN